MLFFKLLLLLVSFLSFSCLFIRNTFYLIFNLLLIFFIWAILFFYFCDFISLLIILVYTGGIAVLFLFTSMSVDINLFSNIKGTKSQFISQVFLTLLGIKFTLLCMNFEELNLYFVMETLQLDSFINTIELFSGYIYKDFPIILIAIALILLVTMIGSLSIFLQPKPNLSY